MDSSTLLGSVEIDVRANLDKLAADFARGRVQTQAFAGDMGRVVGSNNQLAGSTAALSTQLNGLIRQYDPLRVAQQTYTQDVSTLQRAQKAGLVSQTEAVALQGAMGRAYQDTQKRIEGETVGLEGWARSTEHHLRAMRLLISFVGVDLATRLGEFAIKTIESTAAIKDEADQLGLTTDQLQEYKIIAGQVGMTSEDMVSAFKTLGTNLDDLRLGRVGPFSKLIQRLGVDIKDAAGNVRPTSAIFNDLIDKLRDVGDQSQRQGANLIAFGEAGAKMGDLERRGSSGVDELRNAVKQMGLVLSEDQIQRADQTAKKLSLLGQALKVEFADTVVKNAESISQLATALETVATISLTRIMQSVGDLITRIQQFGQAVRDLRNVPGAAGSDAARAPSEISTVSDFVGGYYYGDKPSTGLVGKVLRGLGIESTPPPSITVPLPEARPATPAHGPNIDLSGILSSKGAKAKQPKFDEFAADMDKELERQLQLEHDATGDLERQNEIDKQLVDLKLAEQVEQIKRQVHGKQLTADEGKKLTAEAKITATMEKEAADRKLALAVVEQQAQYADAIEQLMQDGLSIARALARTDKDRRAIDLQILDSKQRQLVSQLETQITEAQISHDATREAELRDELIKLRANQLNEIKQFDIEHLTGIDKFKNDLPKDMQEFDDAMRNVRFDLFNQKLQEAAQFASDIGDAFGNAVDVLITTRSPLQAFTSLVTDLAKTFNKAVIEEPLSNLIKDKVGIPAAQQVFGKQLTSLSANMGGVTLTTRQLDTALAQATASLYALQQAAIAAAAAQGGSGGAGMFGQLASLAGGGDGSSLVSGLSSAGAGLDFGIDFSSIPITGFSTGGFTGGGPSGDVKGLVHANEFVLNSEATKSLGVPFLSSLNDGSFSVGAPTYSGSGSAGDGGLRTSAGLLSGSASHLSLASSSLLHAADKLGAMATPVSAGGGSSGKSSGFLGSIVGMVGGLLPMLALTLTGHKTLLSSGQGLGTAFAGKAVGGFEAGGFTGDGPSDQIAGWVHRGEWVWDSATTKRFRPLLAMLASSGIPDFKGGSGLNPAALRGPQPLHVTFGQLVFPGVTDARTARQSATQATSTIHRGITRAVRKGMSTQ